MSHKWGWVDNPDTFGQYFARPGCQIIEASERGFKIRSLFHLTAGF